MKKNSTGLKAGKREKEAVAKGHKRGSSRREQITIGLDLGDKTSRYCALGEDGEVLFERAIATTKKGMAQVFGALARCRVALEVGSHSPWVSRLLSSLGHEVIVANARQVKLISQRHGKMTSWTRKRWRGWRGSIRNCCDRSSTAASKRNWI